MTDLVLFALAAVTLLAWPVAVSVLARKFLVRTDAGRSWFKPWTWRRGEWVEVSP